jgi:hypothetical protein
MACPVCGDICQCSREVKSAGQFAGPEVAPAREMAREESRGLPHSGEPDCTAWRQEIAARLNRYQSRRKPRPPRYPSLRLRFEQSDDRDSAGATRPSSANLAPLKQTPPQISPQISHALALDGFAERVNTPAPDSEEMNGSVKDLVETPLRPNASNASGAKIIEFPHPWSPPMRPADELAEPVLTAPRILEVPEYVPPPPALGGIMIEPSMPVQSERRPGIDFPLRGASLGRRTFAAATDGILVGAAGFAFAFIFWKLTALRPPRLQMIEMGAGFGALFWAAYQYLLIVYSGSTPGLWLARLQLTRFDGACASRRLRRWRVLTSFLSALSLAMGYAWVFLDEDSLCWHDRITHTYLAPKRNASEGELPPAERMPN